ncbi:putative leucine-rich repeat-containing protein DDB_G0290503 [Chironomus tepperi]|uniref:putative leucine-rich repeat-containing protein DDB_G0290503 n=1 Tax=Chironomus tepperi TaxID=113505 RepID=UPI00391F42BB
MIKAITFLVFLLVISFDSSESATLECEFKYNTWHVVGSLYTCYINKGITINTLDTAYIDSTTGNHQSSHTNDNVNYLYFVSVTISYFPRGIDAIFKNLKGIYFNNVGLKEIQQSDLKPFPKLIEFLIQAGNYIEILEEGLFDFNPELEYINLYDTKITHIDPKVFDSLTKLRQLYLSSNTCINQIATNRTSVLNLIKELPTKCNNSEYSSLAQELTFLESESKSLNFNDFKLELENLESKINSSKFVNFYQTKLQHLKDILNEKSIETKNCSALNVKIEDQMSSLKDSFSSLIKDSKDNCTKNNENYAELSDKVANIQKSVEKVNKKLDDFKQNIDRISTIESESKATHEVIIEAINKAVENIEMNLMAKMDENFKEINKKVQESEIRFNERTAKIMKSLKVIFDVSDMALNYSLQ